MPSLITDVLVSSASVQIMHTKWVAVGCVGGVSSLAYMKIVPRSLRSTSRSSLLTCTPPVVSGPSFLSTSMSLVVRALALHAGQRHQTSQDSSSSRHLTRPSRSRFDQQRRIHWLPSPCCSSRTSHKSSLPHFIGLRMTAAVLRPSRECARVRSESYCACRSLSRRENRGWELSCPAPSLLRNMIFGSCISFVFATFLLCDLLCQTVPPVGYAPVGYVFLIAVWVCSSACCWRCYPCLPLAMIFLFFWCLVWSLDVLGVDDQAHHLLDVCIAYDTSFLAAIVETPLLLFDIIPVLIPREAHAPHPRSRHRRRGRHSRRSFS